MTLSPESQNVLRNKIWAHRLERKKLLKEALKHKVVIRELRMKMTGWKPTTIEEAVAKIGRYKDRIWLISVIKDITRGKHVEEALEDATKAKYPLMVNQKKIMSRAINLLRQPDVCQAMSDMFAVCGFSMEDAIKTHIGHIQGTHTREVLTKEGVETLRIPPSFAALQAYEKLVVPAQTAKVSIQHSNVNDMLKTIDSQASEVVEHRVVGEIIDTDPEIDPDDIDPFDGIDDEDFDDDEDENEEDKE